MLNKTPKITKELKDIEYTQSVLKERRRLERQLAHSREYLSGTLLTVSGIAVSLVALRDDGSLSAIVILTLSIIAGVLYQYFLVASDEESLKSLDEEFPTFLSKFFEEFNLREKFVFSKVRKLFPMALVNNNEGILLLQMILVLFGFIAIVLNLVCI